MEPYSLVVPQRRSTSEIRFSQLINSQFGSWNGSMVNSVRPTRNRVNKRKNRVIPGRLPSRIFVQGKAREMAIREGVVGNDSLIKRLNNRGKVTINFEGPKKRAEQVVFSAQQALYH